MTTPSHVWLRVLPGSGTSENEFKSEIKRSLFAASFHFKVRVQDGLVHVDGAAEAKVPLKEPWRLRASTSQASPEISEQANFSEFNEIDDVSGRVRQWINQGSSLIYRELKQNKIQSERTVAVPAGSIEITSPLLLLPGLCSSFSPHANTYGSVFVAGSKFAALRLEKVLNPELQLSDSVCFNGTFQTLVSPISHAEWDQIIWRTKPHFQLYWNPERNLVTQIGAEVPMFGRVDFRF